MKTRKILALVVTASMALPLAACGSSGATEETEAEIVIDEDAEEVQEDAEGAETEDGIQVEADDGIEIEIID